MRRFVFSIILLLFFLEPTSLLSSEFGVRSSESKTCFSLRTPMYGRFANRPYVLRTGKEGRKGGWRQEPIAAGEAARKGRFTASFSERSPFSDIEEIKARLGASVVERELAERPDATYELNKELYSVYVPHDYTSDFSCGLLVWIDPQGTGALPQAYESIMDEYRLIWIGPDKSGNNRPLWHRLAPAIDAVHNMKQQYNIDANRVYVGGFVDGSRSASFLAVAYPELFHGGFYVHGGYYFRPVAASSQPGRYFHHFKAPPGDVFQLVKQRNRYALLTGDSDMHLKIQELVKATYSGYVEDGFRYVTYIEAPGLGRRYPDANWFRRGVAFLEDPSLKPTEGQPSVKETAEDESRPIRRVEPAQQPGDSLGSAGDKDLHFTPGVEVRIEAREANNTFLVYVPLDYTPERSWPVIFCYHGYGGSATTWPFKQVTEGEGFIIVGMNYATKDYHKGLDPAKTGPEKAFFDEALSIASLHLTIDPEFIFMGGYSQGGYSTTVLGEQMLDRLAGRLILGGGRRDVDQNPPPYDKLRGKPVFFGVGELDDPHYLRAKRAAQVYEQWGADVTFEGWPGETHGLSPNWLQKTKMRYWLIAHGPLKQVERNLSQARAAEQEGRLGEAFTLYDQAAQTLPDNERCIEAAASAHRLFQKADAELAEAREAMANKPYSEAARLLDRIAETYAGSVFSNLAKQHLKNLLNAKADELEERARDAETAQDYAKALQLYDLYLTYFAGADRYETVKAHVKALRTKVK